MMMEATFNVWIPRYISSIETKNYSKNTIEAYGRIIKLFAGYKTYLAAHDGKVPETSEELKTVGTATTVEASQLEVEKFLDMLRSKQNLKPATMQQYESALTAFYRYLAAQGVVATNPMEQIERPKIKDRVLKYMHHDEVMEMLSSIKNARDALIIRTIYVTGMLASEICSIQVEDIDFEEKTIRVHGKGGKVRTVFCDPQTLSTMRAYLDGRTEGRVFPISTRHLRRIVGLYAPEGISPHKIRHSYASELYKRSHDLQLVQETLGHASIQTTQVYIHTDVEERRKAYRQYFPAAQPTEGS